MENNDKIIRFNDVALGSPLKNSDLFVAHMYRMCLDAARMPEPGRDANEYNLKCKKLDDAFHDALVCLDILFGRKPYVGAEMISLGTVILDMDGVFDRLVSTVNSFTGLDMKDMTLDLPPDAMNDRLDYDIIMMYIRPRIKDIK